jgi:RND family efflux transporter MFP subunit
LAAVVGLAWLGGACNRDAQPKPTSQPPVVTVSLPAVSEVTEFHEFTGHTEAVETVDVRARVRGFLQRIDFVEGADVKQGQVLYEIDPRTFHAELEKAQADVLRITAQLNLAKSEEARAIKLIKTQAITPEEYTQRVATREQAEAELLQANAAVDVARLDVDFTVVRSPINGRVGRTLVTVGNLVGYNEPTLLTTIVRLEPIYVLFDATERGVLDYEKLIREQGVARASDATIPLYVGLETDEGYPRQGVINFRENAVDPGTGTLLIRGVLPNADKTIAPGMFVRVRVPIGKPQERMLIPQIAISTDQRGDYVYVVKSDGTVEYRVVTTGQTIGELIVVDKGLQPSDKVIVDGIQKAQPDAKVTPQMKTLEVPKTPATSAAVNAPQPKGREQKTEQGKANDKAKEAAAPATKSF